MHSIKSIYTIALSALMLIGYASTAMSSEIARVTGTLTYPRHAALPPDAVVYITLVDVSPRQDASGDIIARQTITNPGQIPIPFELKYNLARINSKYAYAIQAQITVKGKLLFRNTSPYPVITRGNPNNIDVIVNLAK
jgi:putative lipoprotein